MFNKAKAFFLSVALALAPAIAFADTSVAISVNPASLTRSFTSSTTDTVPSWATGAFITEVGGGGGGSTYGGVSGTVVWEYFATVTPGATLTITIGAGGAGSSAVASNGGKTSVTGAGLNVLQACGGSGGTTTTTGNSLCNPGGFSVNQGGFGSTTNQAAWDFRVSVGYVGAQTNQVVCGFARMATASGACTAYGGNGVGYGYGGARGAPGTAGGNGLVFIRYVQ